MPPSKSTVDFATREAIRKDTKINVERTRGRQHRATAKARSKAKQAEQAQKAQLAVETAQRREDIKAAAIQQRAALKAQAKAAPKQSNARRVVSGVGTVAGAAGSGASTASDTTVGQVVILVLSIMGGLIIFYLFVTRPNQTSLKSQQLTGWLNMFSTDSPLFVKVSPTKNTGTRPAGGSTGSTSSSGGNVA